jgi:RNA polymerase sigma-70 factor (ECF subfamily)
MGHLQIYSIKDYLYQSIRNVMIDLARKRQTRIDYINAFKDIYSKGIQNTESQVIENDLRKHIENEIDKLPPRMKAVFLLSRKQYRSIQEIAIEEGISPQTVKNLLYRASMKIKSRLFSVFLLNLMWAILWFHKSR